VRIHSPALLDVLKGSFDARWTADVILDGVRRVQDLPILNPAFDEDSTSLVQGTGSVDVVYQGNFFESIAPKSVADVLSPFGTQLWVYVIVNAGDGFVERVPFGHYNVTETPSINSERMLFQGAAVSKGDRISLTLKDLFDGVQHDRFDAPGAPPSLASVWAEVQRLTGLPITRTIADAAIPSTTVYQDDKLQPVYDLGTVLDAVPYLTSDGTVAMRSNVWPGPIDVLQSRHIDPAGTLLAVHPGMANDTVYNKVVVRTNAADNTAVLATAEVTSGPLRTRNPDGSLSPYRSRPYFFSSDFVTTQQQGADTAAQLLPRVSQLRGVTVDLTEVFNPLRENGDVITVKRLGETFVGRVSKVHRSGIDAQTTTVAVNP
jgi:hypothetical protein